MENTYLTTDEAAEILRVKPETVRAMCRRGDLRYLRVGRDFRIPQSALIPVSPDMPTPAVG